MEILPNDIAVFTTKNGNGELIFNQEVGTKKSAKGWHFIAFTTLPDLPPCKSISLWKVEETQAPNHNVIGLHDGTLYTVMIMYSQDKI
jgi:hypothetical protein